MKKNKRVSDLALRFRLELVLRCISNGTVLGIIHGIMRGFFLWGGLSAASCVEGPAVFKPAEKRQSPVGIVVVVT